MNLGRRSKCVAGIAMALAFAAALSAAEPGASPFLPAGSKPAPAAPAPDLDLQGLQLSEISVIGDEQQFNLVNTRTKQSFWLGLGASEGGFTVESYDAEGDSVVVSRGGKTRRLELRQSKIIASGAANSTLPALKSASDVPDLQIVGVDEVKNPKTPKEIKQAEFEARMLVSDLLEISMQERARQRALREAKAKQ